jgi:phosphoserine phosphatase RsbU/P
MAGPAPSTTLNPEAMLRILEVTRKLSAPASLDGLLREVLDAAKSVLSADRGTLWVYLSETDELEMHGTSDGEVIRVPAGSGIVGHSARALEIVNVPDAYADDRFNRSVDDESGYRTRCILSVPLVGHEESLVGVLQLLNKSDGVFNLEDEAVASSLAAQCAVAIQRAQMTEALVISEKLDQEVSTARQIQMGTLPQTMPQVEGYDIYGCFRPTDATGGDTFDFVPMRGHRLFMMMGDATGHGFGPALSATQMRAMLRIALRMGATLDDAYIHVNNQMEQDLPDDRFVTAFLGELDPRSHGIRYHSGGQGPLLHFKAASADCEWHKPTTFPLGVLPHEALDDGGTMRLEPGDVFGLISDGIYEYEDPAGEQFGEAGVAAILREHHRLPMETLAAKLLAAVADHGAEGPQEDDITIVLVRRRSD